MSNPAILRSRSACLALVVGMLCGTHARAEFDYGVSLSGGHSDNIARTEANKIEDDIAAAGAEFSLYRESNRLSADAIGNLLYYDYLDDTFQSEFFGNLSADVAFRIAPERFHWYLSDNFGQVLNDPFMPATPDNRENINYFLTGPDFILPIGSQTRFRLGGRYGLTSYEDSPLDSDTALATATLQRLLSSSNSVSLNARRQEVSYDESLLNGDYTQTEMYLGYEAEGARTNLSIDLGYTEMDRDASTDKEDGALLRLEVSRRLSASSVVLLSGGQEFSSSGQAFAAAQSGAGAGVVTLPGRQTVQPFVNKHATLGYIFTRERNRFALTGTWSDQKYDDQPILDQTLTTLTATFRRELSQRSSLEFDGGYILGDFEQGADYGDLIAGATFEWRLSETVSLGLTYDYYDRSSDLATGDFTENRFWLSISYSRGRPRQHMMIPEFAIDAAMNPNPSGT